MSFEENDLVYGVEKLLLFDAATQHPMLHSKVPTRVCAVSELTGTLKS